MSISLRHLIEKYLESIPRYTSYPTAVEFHQGITSKIWAQTLEQEKLDKVALYLHIPFCHSLCYYCACNKVIANDDSQVLPYLEAIKREIAAYDCISQNQPEVIQFHWGGGTPNFVSANLAKEFFNAFKSKFSNFSKDSDISIEVDPRTISSEQLNTYRELGFNRLSAGVQDFNLDVQETINRIQSFEQTFDTCAEARKLGFKSINLDLIYGLPKQSIESISDTIDKVLTIRPERIALYGYAHVTWIKKAQKSLQKHDLPSAETRINLFLTALESLTKAGYVYIGMDHFALPEDSLAQSLKNGKINRNFMGYSTHKDTSVLGFGVSSISSTPKMLAQNTGDLESYLNSNGFSIIKGKDKNNEDILRAELIEDILCSGIINTEEVEAKWGITFHDKFQNEITKLENFQKDSLLTISDKQIKVTELGRLFMRNIASSFDQYLASHKESQRFSKSI